MNAERPFWCLLLAEDFNDLKTLAQAKVTKGITLARASEDIQALPYFDEAIRLYERAGDELSSAKVRLNRIKCYCNCPSVVDCGWISIERALYGGAP